ncbi:MFS transporter [Paenibacillus sp. P26]|nr:MFS transporter [Paenibacillus sp. P26]
MGLKSRISLLFLAVTATFGTMIAAPVVKLLAVAFPETDRSLIQWIVTISSLFILPTLFMASYLARNFPRKNILIVGLLLYIVGGIGPALSSSFTVILLFRAIMGISIGLISPAFNSLIAENFQGRERAKMNGYVISITGIGGAVFLPIGGNIASFGWRAVFLTYLYAVIQLILVVLFLPKFSPAPNIESRNKASWRLPRMFYAVAIAGSLTTMLYFLIPTTMPLYLADNGIGSVSSVGYLTALSLIGSFIAGLSLTTFAPVFGRMLAPLALMVMAVGFLTVSMAHSVWTVGIGVILLGFAQGFLFPLTFNKTAEIVPVASLPMGISLLLAFIYIFQFISPLFMKGIQVLFHFSSTRETFLLLAGALLVTAIGIMLITRNGNHQSSQNTKLKQAFVEENQQ